MTAPAAAATRERARPRSSTAAGGSLVLLGGFVALVSPVAGAAVATAVIFLVLLLADRRDAVTIVGAMFVLFVAVPTRFSFVGFGPLTPGMLVGSLAAIWWLRGRVRGDGTIDRGWQPIHLLVLLLLTGSAVGFATIFTHPVTSEQFVNAHRSPGILVMFVGITLLLADGIPDRQRLDTMLEVLVLCGGALALCGLVEQLTGQRLFQGKHLPLLTENPSQLTISPRNGFLRIGGTAKHPIEFAVVLGATIPLGLHLARYGREAFRRTARWITIVMLVALPLAISRSGVICLAVGVLVMAIGWSWRSRLNALALAAVVVGVIAVGSPRLVDTVGDLFLHVGEDTSIAARTRDYRVLGDVLHSSPVFGDGLGSYNVVDFEVFDNQYLASIVDGGYVGLGVEVLSFLGPALLAWSVGRRARDEAARHLAQAMAGSICALGVTWAFFDGAGYRIATALVFTLTGLVGALWRLEVRDRAGEPADEPPTIYDRVPMVEWGAPGAAARPAPAPSSVPVLVPMSVVVPAHDEEVVIGRFLWTLLRDARPDELDVVVVCNGCSDRTAAIAREFPVRVLELDRASKHHALNQGDAAARHFPRFYVDADVRVTAAALRSTAVVLASGEALAAAPRLRLDLRGCDRAVRAYYRTWRRLPYCTDDLIGSGVYGVSAAGRARLGPFPPVIADDLWVRDHFRPGERRSIPAASFLQHPPRDLRSLVRVRTRQRLGNLELRRHFGAARPAGARAPRGRSLGRLLQPGALLGAPVYVAVNVAAKRRAARRWRQQRLQWDHDVSGRLRSAT
jgi:hypothetical protein